MRVLNIIEGTIVDGVGLRTAIYFAGCKHHCKGCHNPESWDMDGGIEMSVDEITQTICANKCTKVTLSGGDPLFQNKVELLKLVHALKDNGCNIWLYTGFEYEYIAQSFPELLTYIDVMVDGQYMEGLRYDNPKFRGSRNQRIIDVQKSLIEGEVWEV